MISQIYYALKYIRYRLFAKHKKGHGIHSPFVYNLITEVFNQKENNPKLIEVNKAYNLYANSDEQIEYTDLGAGSKTSAKKILSLKKIVKKSAVTKKYGKLLFFLIHYFKPSTILELGTSVGISTAFIASAATDSEVLTIEASESKLKKAIEIAKILKLKNIRFVNGDFDEILDTVLLKFNKLDFVFFDGNHKKEATLKYFNACMENAHRDSVFVFDDIHWSEEMEKAWEEIKRNPKVRVSIDIFRMGIIFFRSELSYQHYVIKF